MTSGYVREMPTPSPSPDNDTLGVKVRKTLAWHRNRALVSLRGALAPLLQPGLERPVFVVGCSRAGTTLMYKLLSGADELGSLQRETHDQWAALHPLSSRAWRSHVLDASDASEGDRRAMARYFYVQTGRRRIVDKNNQNGLCVPYLQALYPDARFVYVKRQPGDNISSLIEGWGRADEFGTWAQELPEQVAISQGRYARWCFFLPEGWRDYLRAEIEEVCAYQYASMNRAIIEALREARPGQWIELRYEDLLASPEETLRDVFAVCDVEYTAKLRSRCEQIMATPFNAFSEIRADKWRSGPHSQRIERVLDSVSGIAAEMGYPG